MKIIAYTDKHKDQTIRLILNILEDEFGYTGIERPDLQEIPKVYQNDAKSNFWLAISDNEVVGTIAIKNYGNGQGLLKRMYVKQEMRSKGIGQKLLDALMEFAKKSKYKTIFTSTVEEFASARNFYKKNGFAEIEKLPENLPGPYDNVFLELKLEDSMQETFGDYTFTDDQSSVDLEATYNLLRETYWAKDRTKNVVEKSIKNSLCFSILHKGQQIGIARAISDFATYAAILDLVIDKNHRGKGLGKKMVEFIQKHPKIKDTKKILWTKDAEKLYEKYGFKVNPEMKVLFQYPETLNSQAKA